MLGPGDPSGLSQISPVYGRIDESHTIRSTVRGPLPLFVPTGIFPGRSVCSPLAVQPAEAPGDEWYAWSATVALGGVRLTLLRAIERTGRPGTTAAPSRLWGTREVKTDARVAVLLHRVGGDDEAILIAGRRLYLDGSPVVELPLAVGSGRYPMARSMQQEPPAAVPD